MSKMPAARNNSDLLIKWVQEASGKEVESMTLGFRASFHGCSYRNFHKLLDDKGPVLFIMKSKTYGKTFGGFIDQSFSNSQSSTYS